jgi:hypothetical protein
MPREVVSINTSHYRPDQERYVYRLPTTVNLEKATLSLHSFSMYNSTFNISEQLGNNRITFTWIDDVVYNYKIDDGYYSIENLSLWVQSKFIQDSLYVSSSDSSTQTFFVRFLSDSIRYGSQIDIFPVPTASVAAQLGYVKPASATWSFPSQAKMPKLVINEKLRKFFGFVSKTEFGFESGTAITRTYLSDSCPQISPTFSIVLACNLIVSSYNQVANAFCQIPINKSFGSLIEFQSSTDQRVAIRSGLYSEISIQLLNQNYERLQHVDKDASIFLIIETPDK